MRIFDVVEYPSEMRDEIIHQFPEGGMGYYRIGSQVIVREGQVAVFFRDGNPLDIFRVGRHTITTANIPLLIKSLGEAYDIEQPFETEIFFLSMKVVADCKWGIHPPILVGKSSSDFERLHAYGLYSFAVDNPALFIERFVQEGITLGFRATDNLQERLKVSLRRTYTQTVWKLYDKYQSVMQLISKPNEIDSIVSEELRGEFLLWGLSLRGFYSMDVSVPEEDVKKRLSQQEQETIQIRDQYNISSESIGVLGFGSQIHNVSFEQLWNNNCDNLHLDKLAKELSLLRTNLKEHAIEPEHDVAIGEVSQAEISAKKGDGVFVLKHLSKVGQWTLDVATRIGIPLAVEAIKISLGLGK